MHVVDRTEKLKHDASDLNLGEAPFTRLILLAKITRREERPASADGQNDVDALVILEELMHRDDIRMLKFTHNVDLVEVGLTQLGFQ